MPNEETFSFPRRVSDEVQWSFDEMIHRPWSCTRELRASSPSVDLYETDDALILEVDLPGVKLNDVRVQIDEHDLVSHRCRVVEHSRIEADFTPWSVRW